MKRLLDRLKFYWKTFWYEEYLLEIYFAKETIVDPSNTLKIISREKKQWKVKKVMKKTDKHIIAKDLNGNLVEIKSIEPFGYNITKIY